MQQGFIKVAAGTPEIKVADCHFNKESIIKMVREAAEYNVKLLVLPELCITGYTCGDLFLQQRLINAAEETLKEIAAATAGLAILVAVGLPVSYNGKLYNCAAILYDGQVLGFIPKKNLPNYSEFYELRHFSPAPEENGVKELNEKFIPFGTKLLFRCRELESFCFAAEICEDLWVSNPPSVSHAAAGATIIGNLSASDETVGKDQYRRSLVTGQSARLLCGYLYADAGDGESTTDLVFAGHNLVAENGVLLNETKSFENGLAASEIDVERLAAERRRMNTFTSAPDGYQTIYFSMPLSETKLTRVFPKAPFVPGDASDRAERCEAIFNMQAAGLKKRLEHSHSQTAVIGISGGLDSCLALLVSVRAMDLLKRPRTDIMAVTMPCFGTTERTTNNAELLCEQLGVTLRCVDIGPAVSLHVKDIGHDNKKHDVVFENSQARERTQVLMDIANQTNGLVVGTGDLSELALGWATYNGDHMSMYGVNASIPKTLVRHLVHYAADCADQEALCGVLLDILDTPVSPELLPAKDGEIAQKTEDLVGPYELHDFFLYYIVRFGYSPAKVYRLAKQAFDGDYDGRTILKWLKTFCRRFFNQQFKRSCMPDGPKVGSVALSPRGDWRMPSDASPALWLEELEQLD